MYQQTFYKGLPALLMLLIAGCTTIPNDLGRTDVDHLLEQRGLAAPAVSASDLVSPQMDETSVIRLALVNNPTLQAEYARLGFAAADVYEAGRIRNPVFSSSILFSNQPGDLNQVTFGLVASFTDMVTLPARKRFAEVEFAAFKQDVGAKVLEVVLATKSAYYDYIAAKQIAAMREKIAKAGVLSKGLAERFHDAGNMTPRNLALEQAAASEARIDALDAQAIVAEKRAALANLLGLSTADDWTTPDQLPEPFMWDEDVAALLELAQNQRLDLAAHKARVDNLAAKLGVVQWTRWLGEFGIGVESERETDGARITGPALDWEIPIFTQNRDQLLRSEAEMRIAVADYAGLLKRSENDVRLAHAALANSRARLMRYRDDLIPARIAATQRALEEQTFMLIGIFEVLAAKQQEYDAYQSYLEAVRDYWLTRTQLERSVGTVLRQPEGVKTIGIEEAKPDMPHHQHHHHDQGDPQ